MNRVAQPGRRTSASVPSIVAKLDLADDAQRRVYELVHRFHAGRWPLFRGLGMRQVNGVLYEAVAWCRMATPKYSVVEYRRDGYGLSWREYRTQQEALSALHSVGTP
jgi:hypothetical protein